MFLQGQLRPEDVVELLQRYYQKSSCDGIFLSDISYLGMRLPLKQFVGSIPSARSPFVVVDGAQALNHRPVDLSVLDCDLYLIGTQKWFQSYHPLRIALVARKRNVSLIEQVRTRSKESSVGADPLFAFCDTIQSGNFTASGETVNIAGLITAAGSLWQHQHSGQTKRNKWHARVSNAKALGRLPADSLSTTRFGLVK